MAMTRDVVLKIRPRLSLEMTVAVILVLAKWGNRGLTEAGLSDSLSPGMVPSSQGHCPFSGQGWQSGGGYLWQFVSLFVNDSLSFLVSTPDTCPALP